MPLSFVSAATDLSPILDAQTLAIVRINLDQVDIPKIAAFLNGEFKEIIPQFEPDKAKADQMLLMTQAKIAYVVEFVPPVVDWLRNKGKVSEIFVIIDNELDIERRYPFFLVVPADTDKPKMEIDAIRVLFQDNLCITFHRHGFIVVIPRGPRYAKKLDEAVDFIKTRFTDPSNVKRSGFAEALNSATSETMIQIVVGNVLGLFEDKQEWEDHSEKLRSSVERFDDITLLNYYLNLMLYGNKLFWEEMSFVSLTLDINKPEFKVEIQIKEEDSAKEIYGIIKEFRKLFSQREKSSEKDDFLSYWWLEIINKTVALELSEKNIIASIDAVKYKILRKELTQTLQKLLPMLRQKNFDF